MPNDHVAEPFRSILNRFAEGTDPFIDETKTGMFRDHSCWKCNDGEKPCVAGSPRQCEYPHARND